MQYTIMMLMEYLSRLAPALAIGLLVFLLARPKSFERIVLYLALFVLLRDAMTPLGLWSFGSRAFFWIRINNDVIFLVLFGIFSGGIVAAMYFFDRENRWLLQFFRGNKITGSIIGAASALVVAAPLFVIYRTVPIEGRGGMVPVAVMPGLLVFALLGNLLEEVLFRGYMLGLLERRFSPVKAGVLSGAVFAFCHVFLATTVTGAPLLVFTLWEGIIAGIVGVRYGIVPAALTHGGAVFLLSSGLF